MASGIVWNLIANRKVRMDKIYKRKKNDLIQNNRGTPLSKKKSLGAVRRWQLHLNSPPSSLIFLRFNRIIFARFHAIQKSHLRFVVHNPINVLEISGYV